MKAVLEHWIVSRWIPSYFQGTLEARRARYVLRHLSHCPGCREVHGLLRMTEPEGDAGARRRLDRMEAAIFGPSRTPLRGRWPIPIMIGAALLSFVFLALPNGERLAFRPKGSAVHADRWVSVSIYRKSSDGTIAPADGKFRFDDSLAFAYSNRSSEEYDHLLLFGVDDRHRVYWFYPAWLDPSTTPAAIPIRSHVDGVELPEDIRHQYSGEALRIFAVFTHDEDATVRDIERLIEKHRVGGEAPIIGLERLPMNDVGQHSELLRIVR